MLTCLFSHPAVEIMLNMLYNIHLHVRITWDNEAKKEEEEEEDKREKSRSLHDGITTPT